MFLLNISGPSIIQQDGRWLTVALHVYILSGFLAGYANATLVELWSSGSRMNDRVVNEKWKMIVIVSYSSLIIHCGIALLVKFLEVIIISLSRVTSYATLGGGTPWFRLVFLVFVEFTLSLVGA
jgi:hypothetical protein